jgi:peroxiredoxin
MNLIWKSSNAQNYISQGLLKVGTAAPNFKLISSNGDSVNLSDYKGEFVLLDFWYVGCKPCIKAYWDIDSLKQELGNKRFVVLGMNAINRSNKINRFKDKYNYKDEVAICRKTSIIDDYKISAYPTIYIVNKEGKIVFASAGYYSDLKKKIREVIIDKSNNNTPRRKFL